MLKPLYEHALPTLERARAHLAAGRSIGVFPEGEVNRDPARLLRGRRGTARLSLETGAAGGADGHSLPGQPTRRIPIAGHEAMELHIGAPLVPPGPAQEPGHDVLGERVALHHHDGDRAALRQGLDRRRQGGQP